MCRRLFYPRVRRIWLTLLMINFLLRSVSIACTGIYIGEECTENGSIFFGRSEDIEDNYCKIFGVSPAKELPEGTYYEDVHGFRIPYSGHVYGYTYVKDAPVFGETMPQTGVTSVGEPYASAGVNDCGVSVSATVSTECNEAAGEADPLDAERGIREISMASVLLGKAATARAGVEYLAKILDEYGAGECNSLMIGDRKEVWFMEILTGHQYVAVKMPKDKASVQPNCIVLRSVDVADTENVIASPNLISLAKEHGFLVTNEQGHIDIAQTYAPKTIVRDSMERYCQGVFYLSSKNCESRTADAVQPWIVPNRKLSTLEVLRLLAYRGAGCSCNAEDGTSSWAIGNRNQAECHVFEIRKDLPTELATIQWQAMADAEYSIFIPYYSALLEKVNEKYAVDSAEPVENSLNWVFSEINAICHDYRSERGEDLCGENIKKYFEEIQAQLIHNQEVLDRSMVKLYAKDPETVRKRATAIGMTYAEEVYEIASGVLEELSAYVSEAPHTAAFVPTAMKEHRMPSLPLKEERLKEEKVETRKEPEPIPEISKSLDEKPQESKPWRWVTGVLILIGSVSIFLRRRK